MTSELENRRALVLGGSKGIGRAIATKLADMGCSVTIAARSEDELKSAVQALPSQVSAHTWLTLDLGNPHEASTAVKNHVEIHGGFDIVVNNAGGPPGGPLSNSTSEALIQAFTIHVLASHELMLILVPFMKENRFGRIINIISTSTKQPIEGLGVSNTIRGAMASWSKTLATELAPYGITVNNVLPGATETERLTGIINATSGKSGLSIEHVRENMIKEIPTGRFASPDEIAAAAAFLASPSAGYVTGTSILVDGGRTKSLS